MHAHHLTSAQLLLTNDIQAPEIEAAINRFLGDIEQCPFEKRLVASSNDTLLTSGKKLELEEVFWEPWKVELDLVHVCRLVLPIATEAPFMAYELLSRKRAERDIPDELLGCNEANLRESNLDVLRVCLSLAGIAKLAERQAHQYAKLRKSGKKPIWCYQSVAHRLSDALISAMLAEFCTLRFAEHVTGTNKCVRELASLSRMISYATEKAVHSYQLVMAGHGYLASAPPSLLHQASLHFVQELRSLSPSPDALNGGDGVENAQRQPFNL